MLLALFRIIEATSGQIMIDGVDIKTLGLHECKFWHPIVDRPAS